MGSEGLALSDEAVIGLLAAVAPTVERGGEPIDAWVARVVEAAAALGSRVVETQRRMQILHVENDSQRTFAGVVLKVENPAVAQSGKRLTMALVEIKAEVGTHPDALWIDLRTPEGQALAARCEGLLGEAVSFTRRQVIEMAGGEPKIENGKPKTRPRLVAIEPAAASRPGASPGVADGRPQSGGAAARAQAPAAPARTAPAAASPAAVPPVRTAQAAVVPSATQAEGFSGLPSPTIPTTNAELAMAAHVLGWRTEEIRAVATEVLGPRSPGAERTAADIARLWGALLARTDRGAEPSSMRELVDQARERLGLPLSVVRAISDEVLEPKVEGEERTPEQLAKLWRALLQRRAMLAPATMSAAA